jgi:hypothetical protein
MSEPIFTRPPPPADPSLVWVRSPGHRTPSRPWENDWQLMLRADAERRSVDTGMSFRTIPQPDGTYTVVPSGKTRRRR